MRGRGSRIPVSARGAKRGRFSHGGMTCACARPGSDGLSSVDSIPRNQKEKSIMHRKFTSSSLIALTALVPTVVPPAPTQNYDFQVVDAPGADSSVLSIFGSTWRNDSELVVQQYFGPNPQYFWGHTAVQDRGAWSVIDVPGSLWCGGSNPSDSGAVALTYASPDGTVHLATWRRGKYTFLSDVPGLE